MTVIDNEGDQMILVMAKLVVGNGYDDGYNDVFKIIIDNHNSGDCSGDDDDSGEDDCDDDSWHIDD